MSDEKKTALVPLSETPKETGTLTRTNFYEFMKHRLDDYDDITLTSEQALRIANHLHKLSTGSAAMIPMYCAGPQCPFASRCPLQQMSKAPIGKQCHPPGTLIYTPEGYVAIEALDPTRNKVVTYGPNDGLFTKRGRSFQIGTREYTDKILRIAVGNTFYDCTKDHICLASWNDKAENLFAVYLMQKGDFWRVGKTTIFRTTGGKRYSGLSSRANTEQCDKIWILGVYKTNTEALLAEEYFSTQGQIGKACFVDRECYKNTKKQEGLYKWVTQEQLDAHHASMIKPYCHYVKFLSDLGLDINYPFWDRKADYRNIGSIGKTFEIRACNVIPEYMNMIIFDAELFQKSLGIKELENRGTKQEVAQIEQIDYKGLVYSLNVEKEHTYIADGIVTHNCLIEVELLKDWIIRYFDEYDVDPNNFTEIGYVNELAEIEIHLMRLNMNLAKAENSELVIDQVAGFSSDGTPVIQKQISPFMELKDKLQSRRSKIIKLMVGDRQEKYKKESALKVKLDTDPSSKMAEMRRKLESLHQQLDKQSSSVQDLIDSPDDQ
jgi:hypothetical protein